MENIARYTGAAPDSLRRSKHVIDLHAPADLLAVKNVQ